MIEDPLLFENIENFLYERSFCKCLPKAALKA